MLSNKNEPEPLQLPVVEGISALNAETEQKPRQLIAVKGVPVLDDKASRGRGTSKW